MLTQLDEINTLCDEAQCRRDGMCACTFTQKIPSDKLIQMVFTNIGNGSGWSHPIHLHGHTFNVIKMGLGSYTPDTGILVAPNQDIICTDGRKFCSTMRWKDSSRNNGNVTGMNEDPPQKDTIVLPTGLFIYILLAFCPIHLRLPKTVN
ncbi:hypothetical protein DPMN_037449 [Dreissena polymorpha]|uniref:Plastocyanin-like domain-containing protein n=1 Tax=Dreissena polymorpha TaxID=45954 RepID=A0A9D4MB12_DREPO|nr:hypothetical protein DPMN_037449 [Dreissena polymorpha]